MMMKAAKLGWAGPGAGQEQVKSWLEAGAGQEQGQAGQKQGSSGAGQK